MSLFWWGALAGGVVGVILGGLSLLALGALASMVLDATTGYPLSRQAPR